MCARADLGCGHPRLKERDAAALVMQIGDVTAPPRRNAFHLEDETLSPSVDGVDLDVGVLRQEAWSWRGWWVFPWTLWICLRVVRRRVAAAMLQRAPGPTRTVKAPRHYETCAAS